MVRYMVALDADETKSKLLLEGALQLAVPGKDNLMLARVIPERELDTASIILSPNAVIEEQIHAEIAERKKLAELDKACLAVNLESSFVVITDDHPGYALCKAAKDYKIDCMIVGRRSLGMIKRLITPSTSKYLIDHADCNVLVFKKPHSTEQSTKQALSAEEKEKRQISSEEPSAPQIPAAQPHPIFTLRTAAEFQKNFSQPRDERATIEASERKIESGKDLELVHELEEQARAEKIKDWQEEKAKERQQRNLERMISLERLRIAEEEERAYRIRKQEEEDTKERVLAKVHSQQDRELTRKMEEEEQRRRMLEDKEIDNRRVQESKDDLAYVVALEEAERNRRMLRTQK